MPNSRHGGGNGFALKLFAAVTSLLLAALVVTTSVCFATGTWQITPDEPTQEQQNNEEAGGVIIGDGEQNGISLMSAKIAEADYADYGVSMLAESAYYITATIFPLTATNKQVDWAVAWANPSSSWAKDKTVTNYVTVTPTSDGALTANVECLQAFGEQIIITVTSRDAMHAMGSCTVDYQQKYLGTTSSLSFDSDGMGNSLDYKGNITTGVDGSVSTTNIPTLAQNGYNTNTTYNANNPINFTPVLSETYTKAIADTSVSYEYYVKLNSNFAAALQSADSNFTSETMATDWVLISEADGDLSDAIFSGISSDTATTTLDNYHALSNWLRTGVAPGVYCFASTLSDFVETANDDSYQSSYHFQVKIVAHVGGETVETVTAVRFSEESFVVYVQNINLPDGVNF